eukprot:350954-Chlamydomonas_euryale.AAC.2
MVNGCLHGCMLHRKGCRMHGTCMRGACNAYFDVLHQINGHICQVVDERRRRDNCVDVRVVEGKNVERHCTHARANHALLMVGQFDRCLIQWKAQHLLILKVEVDLENVVDVVVGEQEECARLAAYVLHDDGKRLQHLLRHIAGTICRLQQHPMNELHEIVLQKEIEDAGLVLVAPYHELGNTPHGLNHDRAVPLGHHQVVEQQVILHMQLLQREFLAAGLILPRLHGQQLGPGVEPGHGGLLGRL